MWVTRLLGRTRKPNRVTVGLNLGAASLSGMWETTEEERAAAWDMHVELVTRVGVQFLPPDEGSLREALDSLYSIFGVTRELLHRGGPSLARPTHGHLSFARVAVTVLNQSLRPFLTKWHRELADYEARRDPATPAGAHEGSWERYAEIRSELTRLHTSLRQYADLLAEVAGVPTLLQASGSEQTTRSGL